jgi:hypothetical protein
MVGRIAAFARIDGPRIWVRRDHPRPEANAVPRLVAAFSTVKKAMSISFDIGHLRDFGWVRINGAIPVEFCGRLVEVLESELRVPVNDPSRWDTYGGEPRDFVPIWGHQAQWDIRQHPNLHHIWATLLGTERLFVSLDSCRFTPSWKPGHAEPYGIHWDHDPRDTEKRMFQGVLALTDTAIDQGGFRCSVAL